MHSEKPTAGPYFARNKCQDQRYFFNQPSDTVTYLLPNAFGALSYMEHGGEVLRSVQTMLVIPDFCDMHRWITTGGCPRTDSVQSFTLPDDAGLPMQAQSMSSIPNADILITGFAHLV